MYRILLIQPNSHQSCFVTQHEDDSERPGPTVKRLPIAALPMPSGRVHLIACYCEVTKMNAQPLETLLDSSEVRLSPLSFLAL